MSNRSAKVLDRELGVEGVGSVCRVHGNALSFDTDGDGGLLELCPRCPAPRRVRPSAPARQDQRARLERRLQALVESARSPIPSRGGSRGTTAYTHRKGVAE